MNDQVLKRRRPYHADYQSHYAPSFEDSFYSNPAVLPERADGIDSNIFGLSHEDQELLSHVAALCGTFDFDFTAGTSISGFNGITTSAVPPPPETALPPRKKQKSVAGGNMPHALHSQPSYRSEKAPAVYGSYKSPRKSSAVYNDSGCLDGFNIAACLPDGALESWKSFCSNYPGAWSSNDGYQSLPQEPPRSEHRPSESSYNVNVQRPNQAPPPYTTSEPPAPMAMVATPTLTSSIGPDFALHARYAPGYIQPTSEAVTSVRLQPATSDQTTLHLSPAVVPGVAPFPQSPALQQDLVTHVAPRTQAVRVDPMPKTQALVLSSASPRFSTNQPPTPVYPVSTLPSASLATPVTSSYATNIILINPEHVEQARRRPIEQPVHRLPHNPEPLPSPHAWHEPNTTFDILANEPALGRAKAQSKKPKPLPTRRGPFKDNAAREKTAQTRKMGSCIRCKMQRIRCEFDDHSEFGPCLTCQKVSSGKIWRVPCLRYKITDIKLNKPGQVQGYEWTQRWNDNILENISNWSSGEVRYIAVSDGYIKRPMPLRVRQFVPQPGDKLTRTWVVNGVQKSVNIPPYAVVNLESIEEAYLEFIEWGIVDAINSIVQGGDSLLEQTFAMAWKLSQDPNTRQEERELLMLTFRMWVAIRLGSKSTVIVGEDTLGMPHNILDESSPLHGSIPLPPVMGAQLDMVLNQHLIAKLRKDLLLRLQKMAQANQVRNWLVIYFIFFILLHNTSLLTLHDELYAQKHGMNSKWARIETVREYHLGANILLAYFHYCNKGIYPFSMKCKDDELKTLAELEVEMINFVRYTRTEVDRRADDWARVRRDNNYSHDFFFVSQMYEEQWQPKRTDV